MWTEIVSKQINYQPQKQYSNRPYNIPIVTGSDASMAASGSAGPGLDPRRGSKFSFENFQPRS